MSSGTKVKAVKVGGRELRLETDFSLEEITTITQRHGLNILFFLSNPELGTGAGLADLYTLACQKAGVPVPDPITYRTISDSFIDVDDDLPEFYEDGVPKEGEPSTE